MKPRYLKFAAGLGLITLLGAACSDDDGGSDASATPRSTEQASANRGDGGSPVETPAAELRAGLTALLQEHVYLAGIAINQAVADGGDLEAPATVSAVGALDANSVALADAVSSVYGNDAGDQFLELWRNHIGFFVDYTIGGATGDVAAQEAARQQLDEYRADFGAFIASATEGEISAEAVAEALGVHVDTLIEAIDAVLAGDPEAYTELREAAQHMPDTALALAGAIAAQMPETFSG